MDKKDFNKLLDLYQDLELKVFNYICRYNRIADEYGCASSKYKQGEISLDYEEIQVHWEETWGYGGHDEGKHFFTWDEINQTDNEIHEHFLEFKRRENDIKQANKTHKENKEREEYERLKRKFENE